MYFLKLACITSVIEAFLWILRYLMHFPLKRSSLYQQDLASVIIFPRMLFFLFSSQLILNTSPSFCFFPSFSLLRFDSFSCILWSFVSLSLLELSHVYFLLSASLSLSLCLSLFNIPFIFLVFFSIFNLSSLRLSMSS